ncbi:cyclase family protein [Candidatus Bathyarchaeota archaeon]|nr:MAG: cyclase family protein [Candidatus Bathyarchaeota archaeon]
MFKFYDVSLPIREGMIVYPGNPSPQIRQYSSIPSNKTNESLICLGSHAGSHVDAKKHLRNDGEGSASLPLNSFYGECQVLDLISVEKEIHKKDIQHFSIQKGDIVLLKTKNSILGYKEFRSDFVHVKLDAAEYLVELGVKTLGFDYLSVKKFGADDEVHQVLIDNLTLFEGLNLSKVPPGKYMFVGFPLNVDCDGAPARVVLIENYIG